MAGTTKKTDLGLLEEDDEFEEFPAEGNGLLLVSLCCAISKCRMRGFTAHRNEIGFRHSLHVTQHY